MLSGPGTELGLKIPSCRNTLKALKDIDDKLSPTVIREGIALDKRHQLFKQMKNSYIKAQPFLLDHLLYCRQRASNRPRQTGDCFAFLHSGK